MTLFEFELTKLLRNKKNWVLLAMTLFSLLFAIFQITKQQKELSKEQFKQTESYYSTAHHQRYEPPYIEEDGSITAENQVLIDQLTTMKQTIKASDDQRVKNNWSEQLALRIQFNQQTIAFLEAGGTFLNLTADELARESTELRLLQQKEIKPTTIEAGQGGWYFVKFIADYWFSLLGVLLVILLCYDAYSIEKETGSLKFLFVQPFSKGAIFRSKVISNFLIVTGLLVVMAAVMFTIGTIRYGTGSLAYPISYLRNGQHAYTTLGCYLLNGFLIQSIVFLFVLVYLFILSMWRSNSFEILGFACVTLLFPLVFFKEVPLLHRYSDWFPFHYFDVKAVLHTHYALPLIYAILLFWLALGIFFLTHLIRRPTNEFN